MKYKKQSKNLFLLFVIGLLSIGGYLGYSYLTNKTVNKVIPQKEVVLGLDTLKGKERTLTINNDSIFKEGKSDSLLNEDALFSKNEDKQISNVVESNFATLPVKEVQTFVINPSIANTLTGKEGTIIEIPANSFETNRNDSIEIKLKEFYKISDMVFANLSTQTTGGELLETGGMIHIEANQGEKKKLTLKKEKPIEVKFPIENKQKNGMRLFTGNTDKGERILWDAVEEPNNGLGNMLYIHWRHDSESKITPNFVYSDENPKTYFNKIFRFPTIESKKIKGKLRVSIKIDSKGQLMEVEPYRGMEFPSELYPYALRAAELLPAILPYKSRESNFMITTYGLELSLEEGNDKRMLSKEAVQIYYDSLEKLCQNERIPTLQDLNYKHKIVNAKIRDSIGGRILSEINLEHDELNYYVMLSVNMGWLNCDRDLIDSRPKLNLSIKEADRNLQISIISHTYKSVAGPKRYKNGEYHFYHLPKGEKLSLLAIRSSGMKKEISYKEIINDGSKNNLEFVELTSEKLESIISEIDRTHN